MALFIVYTDQGNDPEIRPIVRFGQCPPDQIALQADGAGETAIELADFTPAITGGSSGKAYFYNETNGTWSFETFPDPDPPSLLNPDYLTMLSRINNELRACDWTQLADAPLTAPQLAAWNTFRADLRAVPDQPVSYENITWPTPPAEFEEFHP